MLILYRLIIITLFFLGPGQLCFGQGIDFIEILFAKIIGENLPVYNYKMEQVSNAYLSDQIYELDTAVTVSHITFDERPQYYDNVIQSPFLLTFQYANSFDTITNSFDLKYLDFYIFIQDDNGKRYGKEFSFTCKKSILNHLELIETNASSDPNLISTENEYWRISEILWLSEIIPLDSCHLKYMLKLDSKSHFSQSFEKGCYKCETNPVQTPDSYRFFHNQDTAFHKLKHKSGHWFAANNILYLFDGKSTLQINYKHVAKDKLVLKYRNDYEVYLKRTSK